MNQKTLRALIDNARSAGRVALGAPEAQLLSDVEERDDAGEQVERLDHDLWVNDTSSRAAWVVCRAKAGVRR